MGLSKIEWTDMTFNPWIGCTKVSPGCAHCYAERENYRYKWTVGWGNGAPRKRTSEANWNKPILWNKDPWEECVKCGMRRSKKMAGLHDFCPRCGCEELQPTRARVFCASLADVFDEEAPNEWRADLWELIEQTPNLDWLLLTKRPENIETMLPERWSNYGYWKLHHEIPQKPPLPRNIWFGFSAENQLAFDVRAPVMGSFGAGWYPSQIFVSAEPLLDYFDMTGWLTEVDEHGEDDHYYQPGIDWVICGGESGSNARPMRPDWARSLRDQCLNAEVPFFFKQIMIDGKLVKLPELDGKVWMEFPGTEVHHG